MQVEKKVMLKFVTTSEEVRSLYGTAHMLKMEVLINRLMMIHKYIIAVCIDGQERGQGGGGGEEHPDREAGEAISFTHHHYLLQLEHCGGS